MSSNIRETYSFFLFALSLGIQVAAPLFLQSEAIASNVRTSVSANSTESLSLISKKDDDDDDNDDDDERERRKAKEKTSGNGDGTNTSSASKSGDDSSSINGSSSIQKTSPDKSNSQDAKSSAKADSTEKSSSSSDTSSNNSTIEAGGSAQNTKSSSGSATKGETESSETSKQSGDVNQGDVKSNIKNADGKSDQHDTHQRGSDKKADKANSSTHKPDTPESKDKNKAVHNIRDSASDKSASGLPLSFYIDAKYSRKTIDNVDDLVCKHLYSKKLAQTAWKDSVKKNREAILNSKTLRDLGKTMGAAIADLKSSHCSFVTINDEMYHFLHALFSDFNKTLTRGKIDCVGFATGGAPFDEKQIRYILDGSPAAKAGLQIGDKILKVNGHPFVGYVNFLGSAGKNNTLSIDRKGEIKSVTIKPIMEDMYSAYTDAMKKSVRIEQVDGKKIGYIHVWSGGRRSFEALDEIMEDKLAHTDGLLFDIRDGYGGNSLNDLDRFYRPPKAYPEFKTVDRNGKKSTSRYYYDKPIVAIINGGSRSGKELLSFSFKRTGRAKLVGTNTAGAVLAGSLFKLDDNSSLYLAVLDGTVDGVRLEGVGVAPDVVIYNATHDQAGYEKQLSVARETLLEQLKK